MPGFDEIEKQFLSEFNYVEEAKNIRKAYDALFNRESIPSSPKKSAGDGQAGSKAYFQAKVAIPEPYEELTSRNVLVMERLDGTPFINGLREVGNQLARAQGAKTDEDIVRFRDEFKAGLR